jgi:glutamine amidotransferase
MSVAIVRYNGGNIQSVAYALQRCGVTYCVSDDSGVLLSADRVIFPGVGEAGSAMRYLRERGLDKVITQIRSPFLGICLGMQLLCEHSEEDEQDNVGTQCLKVVAARVRRFQIPRKVPHMGWSTVRPRDHQIFAGTKTGDYLYFVHSYRVDPSSACIAECSYEEPFSAAIARANFVGVQFHPERSGQAGERVLRNFLHWRPQ